jgi:hypothetical protein
MTEYFKEFNTIEDFILDNRFSALARKNDKNEIDKLLELYPGKRDMINSAVVLVQNLKINTPETTDEQIEKDLSVLLQQIRAEKRNGRNKRFYLWTSITAVACAVAAFFILFNPAQCDVTEKQHLLSLMETADIDGNEIQIIAGKNQANIDNDQTIIQTEDGNLIVGKDKTLESSEIKTGYLTVVVPKGRRTTLKLSDGSTIRINSGTKLVYPKTFSGKTREIMIDGEAYMDVAKDESRPFTVHTKGFDISVLGTRFNVSAYNNDQENSVVLVEGSVEIVTESSRGKLAPNQGFFAANGNFSIKNVDVYPYVCWKDGVMLLNGESLDDIMKRLSRYYGIQIQCGDRFALEKYKGKINLGESLETILCNISLSTPLSYTKNGDILIVK